jgi:hypothetical protein
MEINSTAREGDKMKYSWVLRIVGVILLVAGIAAIGYFAYTAGVAQGQTTVPVGVETGDAAILHGPWGMRPFHGMAFFPALLCLAPLFLAFFIGLPMRMIFGPHRMQMQMHGRWHGCGREGDVPSPLVEWHRHLHEEEKKTGG